MPIQVRYKNDASQECIIRPTPLVSINTAINKVGDETIGATYAINLTGTILPGKGAPYARKSDGSTFFQVWGDGGDPADLETAGFVGPYKSFDPTQSHAGLSNDNKDQIVGNLHTLDAILYKQKVIRELFSKDGQRLEIIPVHGDQPAIVCYPRVLSVDFSEGNYVNRCDYSISLEADVLLSNHQDGGTRVDNDGNPVLGDYSGLYESQITALSGAYISAFSDNWVIEVDESRGETNGTIMPVAYRITHSMSATGRTHYSPNDDGSTVTKVPAWQNAKRYVQKNLIPAMSYPSSSGMHSYPNAGQYPSPIIAELAGRGDSAFVAPVFPSQTTLGQGALDLINVFRGFNHTRTEDIDIAGGTYNLNDSWVISSGTAYETYSMQVQSSTDDPFISVSIDGTVTGLSSYSPSGTIVGGVHSDPPVIDDSTNKNTGMTKYDNAIRKFHSISNSGLYGVGSDVFKRADSSVAVKLNATPNSVSLGLNEFTGEINYSLSFNNRPTNIISGVLSEYISVEDTYPGDVFATIPVLGRKTGPVLQYLGGRTEYRRSLNLELVMDYTDVGYGSDRKSLMLTRPSLVQPTSQQIKNLIAEMSPSQEPGVRKYFVEAPNESWSPKEGRYSFSISWVYELDR